MTSPARKRSPVVRPAASAPRSPRRSTKSSLVDEVFPAPSIQEVAFELRFDTLLRITNQLADFQEQIRTDFPATSLGDAIQVEGEMVQAHHFRTHDGSQTLRLTVKSFGVIASSYTSFEDLRAYVLKNTRVFREFFGIAAYRRAGLRYINRITVPESEGYFPFQRYVRPLVDVSRFEPSEIVRMAAEIRLKPGPVALTIRNGFLTGPQPGLANFLIDLDAWQENLEFESLPSFLDEAHEAIQREFLFEVTDTQVKRMRGRRE